MYLRCLVQDSPKTWKTWLSLAELWYNSSFHSALGYSPFKALYGYEPNLGSNPLPSEIHHKQSLTSSLTRRLIWHCSSNVWNRLKTEWNCRQTRKGLIDSFKWVIRFYSSYNPILSPQWPVGHFPSLLTSFFGPYKIIDIIGAVAYKLELPALSEIHPIFHIS